MTANGKTRITISAQYKDGHFLLRDQVFMAKTQLYGLHAPMYSIVELRILVPAQEAEALVQGMASGDAELSIERMHPLVDVDQ